MTTLTQKSIALLSVLFLFSWLAACGSPAATPPAATSVEPTTESAAPATTEAETEPAVEADAPAGETRTVQHAMGQTEITCTPQRIVTLGQGATDSLLALGVEPVGIVDPWGDVWYDYLADQVEGIPSLGSELEPNLETIVSLDPDLIIGSKTRHEAIYDQLAAIAPTVFAENIGRVWQENLLLYAQATCLEDKGAALVADWQARIADFREKMGDKLATEISLVRFRSDEARIYTTGFPGSILYEAGLARPEEQYFPIEEWDEAPQVITLSKEQIPMMDGDVMFYMVSDWGNTEATELQQDWTDEPLWQTLRVVQEGQTYPVNEQHWNLGGGIQAANRMLDDLYQFFLADEETAGADTGTSDRQTHTIHHALGEVDVPIDPQRVVVLDAMDNVLALGITPVGASNWMGTRTGERATFPGYLDAATLDGIEWLGDNKQPNLEVITALKPDLILGRTNWHAEIYNTLSTIAPTVLIDQEAVGGWRGQFLAYAAALNRTEQAQQLLADYDARTAALSEQFAAMSPAPQVSVVRFDPDRIVIYEKQIFAGSVLADAGVPRPPEQDKEQKSEQISTEQLPLIDGDVIFTLQANPDESMLAELRDNSLWNQLDAVQSEQVHDVSFDIWVGGWTITGANLILDDVERYLLPDETSSTTPLPESPASRPIQMALSADLGAMP